MVEQATPRRHSEDWFGEWRDHWWNADFLALMARRWGFERVRSVLDVGCGVGHWGRALMPHLPAEATLVGVDREADWVATATASAAASGLGERMRYERGTAESLPFESDRFDLVTCQTVLMHLPDVRAGLTEMVRVAAPGGLVVAAEPHNVANAVVRADQDWSVEEQLALFEAQLRTERGKAALGLGDDSVGERLPGWFAEAGLADVRVYMADKAFPLVPPYDGPGQQAQVAEWRDLVARRLWMADEATSRRYWVAGGGAEADFAERWALIMRSQDERLRELEAQRHASAGGAVFYLVSGRKVGARG